MIALFCKTTNLIKNKRGQALVEFALVVPLFLLLLFGILEGGSVIYTKLIVTEAAREGARAVAVSGDRAQAAIAVNKFPGALTNTVTPTPLVYGQTVVVKVSTTVTIVTPLISAFFRPNPFPVSSTANMREENTAPKN